MSELSEKERYDVFISYSHKDKESVRWLARVLTNFWVPFRRRRRVFFDDATLSAGQLRLNIVKALQESRFLIVCASEDAANSNWVPEEIRVFSECHGKDRILVCRVGGQVDTRLPKGCPTGAFIPDLRGNPGSVTDKETKERFREQALALLAPILGFPDKASLVDTTSRRRQILVRLGMIFAAVLAVMFGVWRWWLSTPEGLHHATLKRLLYAADTQTLDRPDLVSTVPAIAKAGAGSVQRFSGFCHADTFRPLILAAGYASLDPPDCVAVEQQIEKLDNATRTLNPAALLIAGRTCDLKFVVMARGDLEDESDHSRWARSLASTGHAAEARRAIRDGRLDGEWLVEVLVELQANGEDVSLGEVDAAFRSWLEEDEEPPELWTMTNFLERLDRKRQIDSQLGSVLLAIAKATFENMTDEQISLYNNWSLLQQVAAHLAGAKQFTEAGKLLERMPDPPTLGTSNNPEGWAWRGLALDRMGQAELATLAFEQAEADGLAPLPQSRTWGEWQTIVQGYALAGRWRAAFRAASKPPSDMARIELWMQILELWDSLYERID